MQQSLPLHPKPLTAVPDDVRAALEAEGWKFAELPLGLQHYVAGHLAQQFLSEPSVIERQAAALRARSLRQ